jgi:hypothetical protein
MKVKTTQPAHLLFQQNLNHCNTNTSLWRFDSPETGNSQKDPTGRRAERPSAKMHLKTSGDGRQKYR